MKASRWAGVAGAVGGALWIVFAVLAAGEPRGCVGDECLVRLHRDLGEIEPLLWGGALLVSIGLAGGVRSIAPGRLAGVASVAVAAGVALVVAGIVTGNWWALVVPGLAAWTTGFAAGGFALVRAKAVPVLGALLLVASLALFAANDQDARVLLLIPFGLTWTVLGATLAAPARTAALRPALESA